MKIINQKILDAIDILKKFKMPTDQQNERTAYCLLSLLNITPKKKWSDAQSPLVGITPMMEFAEKNYKKKYAPNTRETFRRFSIHQMVQAGIVLYNPDKPDRAVNSPNAVYQISPEALKVIQAYKSKNFDTLIVDFIKKQSSLSAQYANPRKMKMVPVKINKKLSIQISPGEHSILIKNIIEQMAPRFLLNSVLIYVGDTGDKWGYYDEKLAKKLHFNIQQHGKMPDVILYVKEKNWLVLVESVTSHGPIDSKRYIELDTLFKNVTADKVYISAFPDKKTFTRYAQNIAWETETWIADNPTHMIHYNGDKFIGPYKK